MNPYHTYSLAQLGREMFEKNADYLPHRSGLTDELLGRCESSHKAQVLFNYHAQAYLRTPDEENFYQAYAMLMLVGLLERHRIMDVIDRDISSHSGAKS